MPSSFEQAARSTRLHLTPSHGDLKFVAMQGEEAINALFVYRVTALSAQPLPDPAKLVGGRANVETQIADQAQRHFDGVIVAVQSLGGDAERGWRYELELRPWLWVLGRRRNSRIFHEATALEIVAKILKDYEGLQAKYSEQIDTATADLEPRPYTVQYRETDLDFLRRLLEEAGVNFYFTADKSGHQMVLTNLRAGYLAAVPRPFAPAGSSHHMQGEGFHSWRSLSQYQSQRVALQDYNFTSPTTDLSAERSWAPSGAQSGGQELYDYPGRIDTRARGDIQAAIRLGREVQARQRHFAQGDAVSLQAGSLVELKEHPERDLNRGYLVLACGHAIAPEEYDSGGGGAGFHYLGTYELLDSDTTLYPPAVTAAPRIRGPQTGVVIGESGGESESGNENEIDVDRYGRILVRFHWDRAAAGSMRCRVAQGWAGKQWGTVFWPRIGMEVVVEFLEGDPDAPLVTGTVYNATNMPPFALPEQKTLSGWHSRSSPRGGGHNRLTFEDKKDEELIHLRAERDHHGLIRRNEKRQIGEDRSVEVGRHHSETVGENQTLSIGKDRSITVGNDETHQIANTLTIEAGSRIVLRVGGAEIAITASDITMTAPNIQLDAKMDLKTSGGMLAKHEAAGMMTITASLIKIN